MVSKIAVIALVAIVACPILLGYAMNLSEVSVKEYKETDDSVNVTELLWNSIGYNYTHADIYSLNTNISYQSMKQIPIYDQTSSIKTSYPIKNYSYTNTTLVNTDVWVASPLYSFVKVDAPTGTTVTGTIMGMVGGVEQTLNTINNFSMLYYDKTTNTYNINGNSLTYTGDLTRVVLNSSGPVNLTMSLYDNTSFANISAGFHLYGKYNGYINMPEKTKSVMITVNLDSISDSNYFTFIDTPFASYRLQKTTTGGIVSWQVRWWTADGYKTLDLYYDPNRADNTYQILFDYEKFRENNTGRYYNATAEFRYVGSWPTIIGPANYYQKFVGEHQYKTNISSPELYMSLIATQDVNDGAKRSLTMRVDDALSASFEYPTILNQTYDPGQFKTNPATKLTNIDTYGEYIAFGGNNYKVTDGNITLGTHSVPLKDLVFSSVPGNGVYENKIGNTVVSTSLEPAQITFTGIWSLNVTTTSMEEITLTMTQWNAGQFAWDGMDSNFLMVGLLTSVGIFIALGIYSRRSKSSVWPLMLVAGGAAFLFLIMM